MWVCACTGSSEDWLLLYATRDEHVIPLNDTCTSILSDPEALAEGGQGSAPSTPEKSH